PDGRDATAGGRARSTDRQFRLGSSSRRMIPARACPTRWRVITSDHGDQHRVRLSALAILRGGLANDPDHELFQELVSLCLGVTRPWNVDTNVSPSRVSCSWSAA